MHKRHPVLNTGVHVNVLIYIFGLCLGLHSVLFSWLDHFVWQSGSRRLLESIIGCLGTKNKQLQEVRVIADEMCCWFPCWAYVVLTKGRPTWVVCGFMSVEGTSQ